MKRGIRLILIGVAWACAQSVFAGKAIILSSDQQHFLDALDALKEGDRSRFKLLKRQLNGYILYPYLEYEDLRTRLDDNEGIAHFLDTYPDTVLAKRLRRSWLGALGKRKAWQAYLEAYRPSTNKTLQCYRLRAGLETAEDKQPFIQAAKKMWLTGTTLPEPCSPVFNYLYEHRLVKAHEFWKRVGLAMDKRNLSLARFLAKRLPKSKQQWFARWQQMDKSPRKTLQAARDWVDVPEARDIIAYGIKRYSREDTVAAWELWQTQFKPDYDFDRDSLASVERRLALRAAWRHMPEANQFLSKLKGRAINQEAREWRIRSALREKNWKLARKYLHALPDEELITNQWQYWSARVNEQLGQPEHAEEIYRRLANETDYYGFLAAEKLGLPYTFTNEPVVDEEAAHHVEFLADQPEFRRIRELYELGRNTDAFREWRYVLNDMSTAEKRFAARLADNWEWHFTAIVTTAQAKHFADLDLRFPLVYQPQVLREAQRQQLPPSLLYGVMRRESAFRETAESPAGALGLMQVMPSTARAVGKKLGMGKLSLAQIKDAGNNIRLGATYLRQVLDQYDDNVILATASYNAGPQRVKKWLPEAADLPADIWVDSITFDETRAYVKAVLFYATIFDWKLDNKVDHRLKERMRPVTAGGTTL